MNPMQSPNTGVGKKLFDSEHSCHFEPDDRILRLCEKLQEYYTKTDSADNKQAMKLWKEFKSWCFVSGYSGEDVNHVKRSFKFNIKDSRRV